MFPITEQQLTHQKNLSFINPSAPKQAQQQVLIFGLHQVLGARKAIPTHQGNGTVWPWEFLQLPALGGGQLLEHQMFPPKL